MKVAKKKFSKKKSLKTKGKDIRKPKHCKDDDKYNTVSNGDRYWAKSAVGGSEKVTKAKNNFTDKNYSGKSDQDFIGFKPRSNNFNNNYTTNIMKDSNFNNKYKKPFIMNNKSKSFTNDRNRERSNLSKKVNFDDLNKAESFSIDKSWQGSTCDSKKKNFSKDKFRPNDNALSFLNNDSINKNKGAVVNTRVKAEFIRIPEGKVKFYENKWFSEFRLDPEEENKLPAEEIEALKVEAEKIMNDEIKNFNSRANKDKTNQEARWMKTIVSKGTSGDKVAAQVIMIQDNPLYHLSLLSAVVNNVKVSKKKECLLIIDSLTEMFITDLLHPGRKLKPFEEQSLSLLSELTQGNALARRKRLCSWLFEHELRSIYLRYVIALTTIMNDTIQSNREKAISAVSKLLIGNMENEEVLLVNLVNKIGDPIQKVSAKVIYSLGKFVAAHPGCKQVVLNQVEKLLFRPNIGKRAQYYGTCFLAQFKMARDESSTADSLMHIYFSFFKSCVKTGDIDSRLMKALLTGVSRAFPYATKDKEGGHVISGQHIETIFKIVHLASFTVSVHALSLLFRVARSDRYYSALYKQVLHPKFPQSSMQNLFLNVIFHSVNKDDNDSRVRTFIKRLLEVCLTCPVPLACGILYIISQILQQRSGLLHSMEMSTPSNLLNIDDEDEEKYVDVKEETTSNHEDNGHTTSTLKNTSSVTIDDDDEDVKPVIGGSWFHCSNLKSKVRSINFEPLHRNPAFANGTKAVFTELEALSTHFHPTVALFAKNILSKNWISYSGDPLQDFTLSRFLDRFSYRNPKQHSAHILSSCVGERRRFYNPSGLKALSVNCDEYLNHSEHSIPVDELFLYKYLRGKREKKIEEDAEKKEKKGEDGDSEDDDNSSVCSEEFEEMLDNMMGKNTDELDFADDLTNSKTLKKKGKKKDEDDESGSEDDEDDNGSEEIEGDDSFDEAGSVDEDDELLLSGDDGDNNEVMDFDEAADDDVGDDDDEDDGGDFTDESDDDEDEDDMSTKKKSKKLSGGVKVRGRGLEGMFAPAEQFAEMLEENTDGKSGTLGQLSNRDDSGEKQMDWETKRNWKLHGADKKQHGGGVRGRGKGGFQRGGRGGRGGFQRGGRGGSERGRGGFQRGGGGGRGRGGFGNRGGDMRNGGDNERRSNKRKLSGGEGIGGRFNDNKRRR